jgi:hypothetical protein
MMDGIYSEVSGVALVRIYLALVAAVASATPYIANAKSDWVFVSNAKKQGDSAGFVVQIDKTSLRKTGPKVLYWLRIANADSVSFSETSVNFKVAEGPSLYEDNCTTSQLRIVQGNLIWGYGGPAVPISRPGPWQYIEPDSLAEKVHAFVCR